MSSEERRTWAALISNLLVNLWFGHRIWQMYSNGTYIAPDGLQTWAQTMLWVIPAAIIANIALTILVSISNSILTGEPAGKGLKDERDRKFEYFGMGAMILFTLAGVFSAMIALAMGVSAFNAFNIVYLGMFLGDIANSLVRLGLYRGQ